MTGRDDWFRNTHWTPEIEQAFWARLARSRGWNRAQYLRIQALTLSTSVEPGALEAALKLIQRHLDEDPPDIDRPLALEVRARCHERYGRFDECLADLRSSGDLQASGARTAHTEADLEFGWVVATRGLSEHFDEALVRLARHEQAHADGLHFPVSRFRLSAARALIAAHRRDDLSASTLAREALGFAAVAHSGLRYHTHIGLVGDKHAEVRARLAQLAG